MNLIDIRKSQVLTIDVQERLLPSIAGAEELIANTHRIVSLAKELGIGCTLSEHYVKGLGRTPEKLRQMFADHDIFEKISFSCMGDEKLAGHFQSLKDAGKSQIILLGIETHICVLQTAMHMLAEGFEVFVACDAVSARSAESNVMGRERIGQAGGQLVNCEMIIFEWLERAGTEDFRRALPFIKSL